MAACPLCNSRKGKRSCPALRAEICPGCCGEKRVVEVACPPHCTWLERGTQNEIRRGASDYLRHQDPQRAVRWVRAVERLGFLVETIERVVAAAPRSIEDSDLAAALESARKTFDSEAKGVIYEHLPTSPTAEALVREIVAGVRALGKAMDEQRARGGAAARGLPEWGPLEAAHCFAVLGERCEYHIKRKEEVGSYVAHLRRIYPASSGDEGPSEPPRIVLA